MTDELQCMLVIVTCSAEHSLRSQVRMRSKSDCLLGQLNRILEISDSEAGLKVVILLMLFTWSFKKPSVKKYLMLG